MEKGKRAPDWGGSDDEDRSKFDLDQFDSGQEEYFLDREHQTRVNRVANCDTEAGRRTAAEMENGALIEEEQQSEAERKSLGNDEHVAAIERSGWIAYLHSILLGSRLAWILDAVLWLGLWGGLWWLWISYFQDSDLPVSAWLYMAGVVGVPALSLLCAKVTKGFGQHVAVTRLTNPDNVIETIDEQVKTAGKMAMAAGSLFLSVLALLFFAPPSWSSWISYFSGILAFGANITLGLSAGIGGNAAAILAKPSYRDALDCQMEMKRRARRRLMKFLVVVLVALGIAGSGVNTIAAAPAWAWAIDITDSMDPAQRETAIEAMIQVAYKRSHAMGIEVIQLVKFGEENLLSEMAWVPVPAPPSLEDCSHAKPDRSITKGLMSLSPVLAHARRQKAVDGCLAEQVHLREANIHERRLFEDRLRNSARIKPRNDMTTQLIPLLHRLLAQPRIRAIDVLTDGIDHSGLLPSDVQVPQEVAVLFIMTGPNPKRQKPTLRQVLAAAKEWSLVPGVTVTGVTEYQGMWTQVGGR